MVVLSLLMLTFRGTKTDIHNKGASWVGLSPQCVGNQQ